MPTIVSHHFLSFAHSRCGLPITVMTLIVFATISAGCQQNRLFSPLASRSAMDGSPPSMHGPALAGYGKVAGKSQVRVTSAEATPETAIAPVQQRLATAKRPASAIGSSAKETEAQTVSHRTVSKESVSNNDSQRSNDVQSSNDSAADATLAAPPQRLVVPKQYEGVDVTELLSALGDAPPAVQKAAIGRLIAMSRKKAQPTNQPRAIEDALAAAFDTLPTLPDEVIDRGISPTRIAASSNKPSDSAIVPTQTISQTPEIKLAKNEIAEVKEASNVSNTNEVTLPQQVAKNLPMTTQLDDRSSQIQTVSAESDTTQTSNVTQAAMQLPATPSEPENPSDNVGKLTDAQLFDALVTRLQTKADGESEADRHRRIVMARHLMVLSGDPDCAVKKLEGLSNQEEEYLRHQLLGLWTIIDPNGHPVPSRRLSSALPQIRKATGFLAAASDSLEVRGLEFCTEIEAYGEVKPFPKRQFTPGQEVILYCEVENFVSSNVDGGFETRLHGSYDLIDQSGRRVSSQTLPEDQQVSRNRLRDYFVAYQMYLPDAIEPGRYQLRLTMEDIHGKKYGQSTIDFEIKR